MSGLPCFTICIVHNFEKIFSTLNKHYIKVPLESFGKNPYKVLASTLLSSRTKDEVTLEASKRLFVKAKNLEQLGQLDIRIIESLIYPVGFYKTKAKHLKKLAEIVVIRLKGKIPSTREKLMLLPGVGRKTANLVLSRAFGIPAIAVDTHVHKISNMFGWVRTKTPEQTELELMKILPNKYWSEINRLFVSIGRQFTTQKKLEEFLMEQKLVT